MSYRLKFLPIALKEWQQLDDSLQVRFKNKLKACLSAPCISENLLTGFENHYKIGLRASDYRLVYEVAGKDIYVLGIVAGKSDNDLIAKKI